jgi:DNA-binding transcriptional LysR family regulator
MGFVFGQVADKRLSAHFLYRAELVICAPPTSTVRTANWAQLARLPWVCSDYYCPFQTIMDEAFQTRGLEYQRAIQSHDELSKAEYVMAGVGLALVERSEAESYAATGKLHILPDITFHSDLSLAYLSYRQHDPLLEAVIEAVVGLW